jgi:hypothetical protein
MRRPTRLAALLTLAALALAPAFRARAADDQFSRISPAKLASLIQEAGYRAELIKNDDPAQARIETGVAGYNVNLRFWGCNTVDCSDVQFYMFFDKDPKFTLAYANKWNVDHSYLLASVGDDGKLFLTMDVDLDGGMSASYMKQRIRLFETMVTRYTKYAAEADAAH